MRRVVVLVVLALAALPSAPLADADVYVPWKAEFRPRVDWVCPPWTTRISGDFNGDGRLDRALHYVRSKPHAVCDENNLPQRWHVTLFLGRSGRVDRRVPCLTGASICGVEAVDLNHDGKDELGVIVNGGASFTLTRLFRFAGGALRRIRVRPHGAPVAGAPAGWLDLSYWVWAGGTGDGWGCRTHPDGSRVLVTYRGRWSHHSERWRFTRARLAFDGVALHMLSVRSYHTGDGFGSPRAGMCGP